MYVLRTNSSDCSNSCRARRRKRDASFSLINLTRFYGESFQIVILRFMCSGLLRTGLGQIVRMVGPDECQPLIVVDVCVVTTAKDMDDTCMLASILDESMSLPRYV